MSVDKEKEAANANAKGKGKEVVGVKQKPNERCRCGSNKKYKRCCGDKSRNQGPPRGGLRSGPPRGELRWAEGDLSAEDMWKFAGAAHHSGNIPERNKWRRRAAEAGNLEAQCRLACAYCYGDEGVKQDLGAAFDWYYRAAAQGSHVAMYNMTCKGFRCVLSFDKQVEFGRCAINAAKAAGDTAHAAYYEYELAKMLGTADVYEKGAAASKALKAAIKNKNGKKETIIALQHSLDNLRLRRHCFACGACPFNDPTIKLRVCDRCHTVWFCSRECLERTWPEHQHTCERIVAKREAAKHAGKKVGGRKMRERSDSVEPSSSIESSSTEDVDGGVGGIIDPDEL